MFSRPGTSTTARASTGVKGYEYNPNNGANSFLELLLSKTNIAARLTMDDAIRYDAITQSHPPLSTSALYIYFPVCLPPTRPDTVCSLFYDEFNFLNHLHSRRRGVPCIID